MCKLCVEAVDTHFPDLSDEDRGELLWGATGFPMVPGERVAEQLADHVAHGITTVGAACARANMLVDAAMEEWYLRSQFIGWGWQPQQGR